MIALNKYIGTTQGDDYRLFRIFNYYRAFLSVALLSLFLNESEDSLITLDQPGLYLLICFGYLVLNLLLIVLLRRASRFREEHIILNILVDIVVLTLLAFASGGTNGGLAILIVFPVAAGSILLHGSFSLLFAATASILLLAMEGYRAASDPSINEQYFQAGILGIVFFTTALFVKYIAHRITGTEELAQQRAQRISQLQHLNNLIIQRMQTGIMVVTPQARVRMQNQSATQLLGEPLAEGQREPLQHLPPALNMRLDEWLEHPGKRSSPFQTHSENPQVQANFASLEREDDSDILIFLEDTGKALQQAQQLKLASLGQLTASMAHEIRNPLGAISHAAQLLNESADLTDADQRLTNIIVDNCRRMNRTIENILGLSRRNSTEPESIVLKDWLEPFIDGFRGEADQNLSITIDLQPEDISIRFDPSQLNQVLSNLCVNGIRYAITNSQYPTLRLEGGFTQDQLPYLDIIDNGPGISEAQQSHLFEPFYTTEKKGTGLGLYICKELCDANNARLLFLHDYKPGCCFRIIFSHPRRIL